jgi:3-oxoacyl-[acyl-carrier-protein] synthase II
MATAAPRRAVITGLGSVSPFGRGVAALWDGLVAGRKALRPITLFSTEGLRSPLGGEVPGYAPPAAPGEPTRAERFLHDALAEASADAGLRPGGFDPARAALVIGTNFGGMSAAERALSPGGSPSLAGYDFGGIAARAAGAVGFAGPAAAPSVSCASGASALVVALELVRSGRADLALAAGYDELSLYCLAGLSALRATSPGDITPFDLNRAGTVFSEGAGALVVEGADFAAARGARVLCELAGGAANNDAYHLTAPEKEGRGIVRLMRAALADAGVAPEQVDGVNLHGTGTKYNDLIETKALKEVFGAHARKLALTANKSMLGHTMGAAGAHESIAAVKSLVEGIVPPTVGIATPDPECDLDYCPGTARRVELRVVLKNSYGIGGVNASVVLRKT